MSAPRQSYGSGKRKTAAGTAQAPEAPSKRRNQNHQPRNPSLITPHEAILSELAPKYDSLSASVISSSQIRKRVTYITTHLLEQEEKPRLVLLHSRTAEVGKMITVVEQCKRVLSEEGKTWYQYNQLFDLPEAPCKDVVEETVVEKNGDDEDSDGDDFEVMNTRFEEALLRPASTRTVKSLRIFLSTTAVPELRLKTDITMQARPSNP